MRRFTFLTGFVLLSTVVALPFFFLRKRRASDTETEENIRYDTNEYMAAEGL